MQSRLSLSRGVFALSRFCKPPIRYSPCRGIRAERLDNIIHSTPSTPVASTPPTPPKAAPAKPPLPDSKEKKGDKKEEKKEEKEKRSRTWMAMKASVPLWLYLLWRKYEKKRLAATLENELQSSTEHEIRELVEVTNLQTSDLERIYNRAYQLSPSGHLSFEELGALVQEAVTIKRDKEDKVIVERIEKARKERKKELKAFHKKEAERKVEIDREEALAQVSRAFL